MVEQEQDTGAPQLEMFGAAARNDNESSAGKRLRPERALLRFGVRKDFAPDIPLAKAKQLGIGDAHEDRTAIARSVSDGVPLSERAILRVIEGSDASGHRRATFTEEVHEAVEAFFHGAQALYGFDQAVLMLFSMLSGAPSYLRDSPPGWLLQLLADERELLMEVFAGHRDDRRVEWATIDQDEDDDG